MQKQITQKTTKKLPTIFLYCELVYGFGIFAVALGVALMTKSGWGNSAGTAMAYILSCRFPAFSFGVWSYLIQGIVICVMMGIVRQRKMEYLFAFAVSMINGYCLDFCMWLFRFWQPQGFFHSAASYFAGFSILGIGIALLMKCRLPLMAYDLFVREVMAYRHISLKKVKTALDGSLLVIDFALCIVFFQKKIGIGVGTIISTAAMGLYMYYINALVDRYFSFVPLWRSRQNRDQGGSAAITKEEIKENGETKRE